MSNPVLVLSRYLTLFRGLLSLGSRNLIAVARYRLCIRFGLFQAETRLTGYLYGPYFLPAKFTVLIPPTDSWDETADYFGHFTVDVGWDPPDWHSNPIHKTRIEKRHEKWWVLPDFNEKTGDIKCFWEASRFAWVLAFSQKILSGHTKYHDRLENWIQNWVESNPAFKGVNWKCGQETSIRILHLASASAMLRQERTPTKSLLSLVELHAIRIEQTITYAMAQDNNHGVSEAGGLYVAGSWLASQGSAQGVKWQALGARWLENRVKRLIAMDGGFSMYSITYHREMLDVLSIVEVWRRRLDLPDFTNAYYSKIRSATEWLRTVVNSDNGDVPNIGANDGSRLLPLTDTDYRDFRPSVQLASVLFAKCRAWQPAGAWDFPLRWLGVDIPDAVAEPVSSRMFDDVGFAVLRRKKAMAVMRYPRFKFRPGQADALHVDLWVNGVNLLRDAGSYGYNVKPEWLSYFPGTASHNTIQFDGQDQMPRIGRFLFGDWLKTADIEPLDQQEGRVSFAAAYRGRKKVSHYRNISLGDRGLQVEDEVAGFCHKAVLRWRLSPGDWRVRGNKVTNGEHTLRIDGSMLISRLALVDGWESRYYLDKAVIPVLEVEINQPGKLVSVYEWI